MDIQDNTPCFINKTESLDRIDEEDDQKNSLNKNTSNPQLEILTQINSKTDQNTSQMISELIEQKTK